MAAAYASLASLMTVLDQIQHHPRPPITLDDEQVESLRQNIAYLQDFLEVYSHEATEGVESRILEAAYTAEDIIESHVVDQILDESTSRAKKKKIKRKKKINKMDPFYQSMEKVVHGFDCLKKEVMANKERTSIPVRHLATQSMPVGSVTYHSKGRNSHIVGFDDVLLQVLDELTGHQSSRQILPIIGMGGIGKTTLARNAYESQLIVHHFDIHCWVTISQKYNVQKILLEILSNQKDKQSGENLSQKSKEELGETLHKGLSGRRYLIIMDDMWSIEVWDKVKRFFPNNNNGSRIVITTRMSSIASQLADYDIIKLNFLDEDQSWELLHKNVFGEETCPHELELVGRKIAKNCKGLPLSIAVISGLLAKSTRTLEYWKNIAENLKSVLNLEEDGRCLKILHTSYDHLPIQLKPCFLYMGVVLEDSEIRASILIKQWIAEGFLKPISGKSLEMVAQEYLKDLFERNLVLTKSLGFDGKIKLCYIRDLLRDMCLNEAEKQKFLYVYRMHNLGYQHDMNAYRRVVTHGINLEGGNLHQGKDFFQSASLARSLIGDFEGELPHLPFKLLRVLKKGGNTDFNWKQVSYSPEAVFQLVNSRFLCFDLVWQGHGSFYMLPHKIYRLWNLQTLIINGAFLNTPSEIWMMRQLRHIRVVGGFHLRRPPSGQEFGLWNLQSLSLIHNFNFPDEVVKKIPNIRKLKSSHGVYYDSVLSDYSIHNLIHLERLESLTLMIHERVEQFVLQQNLNFPHSIKKLCLRGIMLHWEDVTTKLGSMPLLQVLKLCMNSTKGSVWNLVEGKFCNLKILEIHECFELEHWVAESIHFPCLEHIHLQWMSKLKEIPSGIGEIPTLQSIELEYCGNSVVRSAEKISEEQEELGNFGLKIKIENPRS